MTFFFISLLRQTTLSNSFCTNAGNSESVASAHSDYEQLSLDMWRLYLYIRTFRLQIEISYFFRDLH